MIRACPRCSSLYGSHFDFCGIDGSQLFETERDPLIGQTLDRYVIQKRLGQGAMGCVYQARHTVLPRDYAIKILYGEYASNKTLVARFRREAEAASQIKHPNVVEVADFGTSETGLTFLVMEFLHGETLDVVLKRERVLSPERAGRLTKQIALGLGALHEKGYVHRDLKPANVLVTREQTEERAKILDFGIVGLVDSEESSRLTQAGRLLGTPLYMAPEQAGNGGLSPSVDLYALGCMLYEMLSGAPPFNADKLADLLRMHAHEKPKPLRPANGLEGLAMRLLEKDPTDRFATAKQIADQVDTLRLNSGTFEVAPGLVEELVHAVDKISPPAEARTEVSAPKPRPPSRSAPKSNPRVSVSRLEEYDPDEVKKPARAGPMITMVLLLACVGAAVWGTMLRQQVDPDRLDGKSVTEMQQRVGDRIREKGLTTKDLLEGALTKEPFQRWTKLEPHATVEQVRPVAEALLGAVDRVPIDRALLDQKLQRVRDRLKQGGTTDSEARLKAVEGGLRTDLSSAELNELIKKLGDLERDLGG